MGRRLTVWRVIGAMVLVLASIGVDGSEKKGIGLANLHAPERIAALNVSWYYTWSPNAIEGAPRDKFVPMVWGGYRTSEQMDALRRMGHAKVVLGFNEPDVRNQSHMSVQDAIRLWPELTALGDRIGSPAAGAPLGPWYRKFDRISRNRGLKVDFMAVHVYMPPDPAKFLARLDAIHDMYQKPIWLTEFGVVDWEAKDHPGANRYPEEQVLAFMKAVLPELEKRSFVERYAWFGAGGMSLQHEQVRTSRLFEKNGQLTALGKFYAAF